MAIARHLEIAAQMLREPNVPPSDRLPYTPEFDALRSRFSDLRGRDISCHEVWEALVSARKRGLVGASRRRRRSVKG
jgi:hypothetical protein